MRICLVSETSIRRDRRAVAEAESLRLAGHQVLAVSREADDPDWVRTPGKQHPLTRLIRRDGKRSIAALAAGLECDLYQPTHPSALASAANASAAAAGSSVLVNPGWPRPPDSDLISLAPLEPGRSTPASGARADLHVPDYRHPQPSTELRGEIVIAFRGTATNPGRYLQTALARSGLTVRHVERIDWSLVTPDTVAVVVVESPLPALPVEGANPGVPVVFWVHHGEHHVDANTRLQRHYGAHAVLLAHSWHLTHRFLGVVDRLPFGVAPELIDEGFKAHHERRWDIGFVGSREKDRYGRRETILAELRALLGEERVKAASKVSPEEMAAIYQNSRLVVDDGAGRHYPITMRVFEATGAGAALLANPPPGIELLFDPDEEFLPMSEDTAAQAVRHLEEGVEEVARSGHRKAWSHHTYDIRVSELLTIVDRIRSSRMEAPGPLPGSSGLAAVVDRFPDAQRIIDLGGELIGALPGREVWSYPEAEDKAEPASFHLAVVAGGEGAQRRRAVESARLAVVCPASEADRLATLVGEVHQSVERHDFPEGTAFTFGSAGYRETNRPDPG